MNSIRQYRFWSANILALGALLYTGCVELKTRNLEFEDQNRIAIKRYLLRKLLVSTSESCARAQSFSHSPRTQDHNLVIAYVDSHSQDLRTGQTMAKFFERINRSVELRRHSYVIILSTLKSDTPAESLATGLLKGFYEAIQKSGRMPLTLSTDIHTLHRDPGDGQAPVQFVTSTWCWNHEYCKTSSKALRAPLTSTAAYSNHLPSARSNPPVSAQSPDTTESGGR